MSQSLDVCGLSCPLPLMKVREVMNRKEESIEVVGDTPAARENIMRLADSRGYSVIEERLSASVWKLTLVLRG